jgi:hypothetical protein
VRTLITLSTLVAALSIGSVSFAGPGPGLPGPGERAGALSRAPKNDSQTSYALTGQSDRGRTADKRVTNRRHDSRTHISHRQFPGDK